MSNTPKKLTGFDRIASAMTTNELCEVLRDCTEEELLHGRATVMRQSCPTRSSCNDCGLAANSGCALDTDIVSNLIADLVTAELKSRGSGLVLPHG